MIIGLCGGTGSGKTTLARHLVEEVGERYVNLIEQDAYYKDLKDIPYEQRTQVNFDHPDSIDFEEMAADLRSLADGNSVEIPRYNFAEHVRYEEPQTLTPKPVTILEGILVLSVPVVREMLDVAVFLETSSDTRLQRRIGRDIKERGRTLEQTLKQYETTISPMHDEFVEPSKSHADIVIPEGKDGEAIIELLMALIRAQIDDNVSGQTAS